jgi:hypothetical protein
MKLRSGMQHPDPVVETASLNSVSSPEIRYSMSVPEEIIDSGKISALQLEAALYACQAHEKILPSGERVGYLVSRFLNLLLLNKYMYALDWRRSWCW